MIIRKHGIELHRVTHDDIELIRTTRNSEDIRSRMFEQSYITVEQQEQWFTSINNIYNYFFIIHFQGKKIGLIHGKDIDMEKRDAEGGIYIWDRSLLGSPIPAKASICFMEASFCLILMNRVFARVRKDNPNAYHYNLALGYVPDTEKGEDYMVLTKSAYEKRIPYLRKLAAEGKDTAPLSIKDVVITDSSEQNHLYASLPEDILAVFSPLLPRLTRPP